MALGAIIAVRAGASAAGLARKEPPGQRAMLALQSPHVIVIKHERTLYLYDSARLVRTYPVDLGVAPNGPKLWSGDGRTPEGTFHIVARNLDSPYHRFLGLDYPNASVINQGLNWGLISPGEAASMGRSLDSGACPDWKTQLGGGIGIHGRGIGRDWTAGCIALEDAHIEELFNVLRIGDPVEILP